MAPDPPASSQLLTAVSSPAPAATAQARLDTLREIARMIGRDLARREAAKERGR
jgi:hypothetical protein